MITLETTRRSALVWVAGVLAAAAALFGCHLPAEPGCQPDESLPRGQPQLSVFLDRQAADRAIVQVDAQGRAVLSAAYTEWMLATGRECRTIPPEDLGAMMSAWEAAVRSGEATCRRRPAPPSLIVTLEPFGRNLMFCFQPGAEPPGPATATALDRTLEALEATFGRRFVRELEGAGLEELLLIP